MQFGLTMFPTHYAIAPGELARAAEERGFESLFFPEHTHIPASRRSPWPGGDELPREYSHTLDQFVAQSALALDDLLGSALEERRIAQFLRTGLQLALDAVEVLAQPCTFLGEVEQSFERHCDLHVADDAPCRDEVASDRVAQLDFRGSRQRRDRSCLLAQESCIGLASGLQQDVDALAAVDVCFGS